MYGKRLLVTLMAIFMLFVLAGCNYGTISSVDEEDYFPHFKLKADKIYHNATRICTDFKDCEKEMETFKSSGAYDVISYSQNIVAKYNPLEDGIIEKAQLKSEYNDLLNRLNPFDYDNLNTMSLDILGDDITRDNKLFEKIFGYEIEKLVLLRVDKHFLSNNITYFETYGKLLEKEGFKKAYSPIVYARGYPSLSGYPYVWYKQSTIISNMYWWTYKVNQDLSIKAEWHIYTELYGLFQNQYKLLLD
ncbi:MAG: hypothetical protein LBF13_00275 [Campylobacteraceae bacterium]|jgi:hypothetical protein|nr:hypothetical protein [Campylobacteraceae bacterium]